MVGFTHGSVLRRSLALTVVGAVVTLGAVQPGAASAAARGNFSVRISPVQQVVVAGNSTTVTVEILRSRTAPRAFTFSIAGLPVGAAAAFIAPSTSTRRTLRLTTAPTVRPGRYRLDLAATAGALRRSASFTFEVQPTPAPPTSPLPTPAPTTVATTIPTTTVAPTTVAPTTTTAPTTTVAPTTTAALPVLRATPTLQTVVPGQPASFDIVPAPIGTTLNYGAAGFPPDARVEFTPNPSFGQMTMTVRTTTSTPDGTYVIAVVGSNASITRSVNVTLIVARPSGLTLAPLSQTVPVGGAASYLVALAVPTADSQPLAFSVSGVPIGAAAFFSPVTTSTTTTLTVATTTATPPGVYALTVTGASSTVTRTIQAQLIVGSVGTPSFGLAVLPSTFAAPRGSSVTLAVTISPQGGFASPITISVIGLPIASGAVYTPDGTLNPITGRLTISTTAATPLGTFPVTVQATGGGLTASVVVSMIV